MRRREQWPYLWTRALPAAGALALAIAVASAPAWASGDRVLNQTVSISEGQDVFIEFPVGALEVKPTTETNELTVQVVVRCKRHDCGNTPERVRLDIDSDDRQVRIEVDGYPRWWGKSKIQVDATIEVPKGHELDVEMGVGELRISDLERDLFVELGVGEIDLELSEASLRSIELEAGVGDASIYGAERTGTRRHLVGATAEWHDGPGSAVVVAEVGVGDVTAKLSQSD